MSKGDKGKKPVPTQELIIGKVSDAYGATRDKAAIAMHDTVAALEGNPLAALLGGIVLGAAAGALIPRGEREKTLLAPLGGKLAAAATAAIAAGREAGTEALAGTSLNKDALRDQVSGLFAEAAKAAAAAGTAAFTAGRDKVAR